VSPIARETGCVSRPDTAFHGSVPLWDHAGAVRPRGSFPTSDLKKLPSFLPIGIGPFLGERELDSAVADALDGTGAAA
jgi:hypothetical protein